MRIIADIPHEACKITVFAWNEKYLIKLERGMLEQTYKIDAFEIHEKEIPKLVDEEFMKRILLRFKNMQTDLQEALDRI
jgi:hypothetical protein